MATRNSFFSMFDNTPGDDGTPSFGLGQSFDFSQFLKAFQNLFAKLFGITALPAQPVADTKTVENTTPAASPSTPAAVAASLSTAPNPLPVSASRSRASTMKLDHAVYTVTKNARGDDPAHDNPDDGRNNYSLSGKIVAIGDSLAYGGKNKMGIEGNTHVGRQPARVLEVTQEILARDPNAFRGRNVIASLGLTNGDDLASARTTLQLLADSGANVALVGVSTNKKLDHFNGDLGRFTDEINDSLKRQGKQNRIGFMGGITSLAADGLHYSNYGILRDAAMHVFQGAPAPAQTLIAKAAPPPKASPFLTGMHA